MTQLWDGFIHYQDALRFDHSDLAILRQNAPSLVACGQELKHFQSYLQMPGLLCVQKTCLTPSVHQDPMLIKHVRSSREFSVVFFFLYLKIKPGALGKHIARCKKIQHSLLLCSAVTCINRHNFTDTVGQMGHIYPSLESSLTPKLGCTQLQHQKKLDRNLFMFLKDTLSCLDLKRK